MHKNGVIRYLSDRVGRLIVRKLEELARGREPFTPSDPETLRRVLKPADVLLVEGHEKVATAIKYLTRPGRMQLSLLATFLGPRRTVAKRSHS